MSRTAKEIITSEIKREFETATKIKAEAEETLKKATERLEKASTQMMCDDEQAHEFKDVGGFTRLGERCIWCGWVHEV